MTAELLAINPGPIDPSVIKLTERLVELVEGGTISSVAIALVHRDGCTQGLWSDAPSLGLLIGAVARLEHKLHLENDDA